MTRRQRDEGFIQAAIFLSPLGWQPQYLSSVILATTGGHPTGMTCQHPTQWRLVEAVWWPHIKEWPGFASSPPGCPQAGLLRASSASCSQQERPKRRPVTWLSCLPHSSLAACCRPMLSGAVQLPAPPTRLLSLSLLCSLSHSPLLNLVPQTAQQSRAPGEFLCFLLLKQKSKTPFASSKRSLFPWLLQWLWTGALSQDRLKAGEYFP